MRTVGPWSLSSDVAQQARYLETDLRSEVDALTARYDAQTMTWQLSEQGKRVRDYLAELRELADRLDELKETI